MRHSGEIEIYQHMLEKLINQREKSIKKLNESCDPTITEKYLEILKNICTEELDVRSTLKELYEER